MEVINMARTTSSAKASKPNASNQNIRARVPEEMKQRWQTAASLRGMSLTNFVIASTHKAAEDIIEKEEKIKLTQRDQMLLVEMLLNPPKANEAMKNILTRYKPLPEKP